MAQKLPQTAAEKSGYRATSLYPEVMDFIAAIQKGDPDIRVETFATTNEGRALPLVIAGPPGVVDPPSAFSSGRPIVFIMANIHAGEVEGKEAALMLLRDLVSTSRKLRDDLVILVAPIYNADGNEKISTEHRTTQNGPPMGVGVRENAQGLDLNRDYMKLESPEARGLISRVLQRWDPLVTVDLHTTNGSYHGYQLTYSPMLNPNAPAEMIAFERDTLLPEIRRNMRKRHGKETYYYGNFVEQLAPEKGWHTFESKPRFGNNYAGLRNRFAILSEAYSYIDFRARVEVTHQFVREILDSLRTHGGKMMRLAARADEETRLGKVKKAGVQFEMRAWRENVPILWERSYPAEDGTPDPWTDKGKIRRTGEIVTMKMTDYGVFAATEREDVPYAYLIDAGATNVIDNLMLHGIVVESLMEDTAISASRFAIKDVVREERAFQKHNQVSLTGKWKEKEETFPAGTFVVRMRQPLARLAFYLLEPRSDDGYVNWNFFDEKSVPVAKVLKPVAMNAIVVR